MIETDISSNYAQIILNMEIEPFKQIITDYNEKVEFNVRGVEKVKSKLLRHTDYPKLKV